MRKGGSGLGNNSGRLKKIRKEDAANTPKIDAMFARHMKRKQNAEEEEETVPPAAAANGTATDAGDSEIGALTTQLRWERRSRPASSTFDHGWPGFALNR